MTEQPIVSIRPGRYSRAIMEFEGEAERRMSPWYRSENLREWTIPMQKNGFRLLYIVNAIVPERP